MKKYKVSDPMVFHTMHLPFNELSAVVPATGPAEPVVIALAGMEFVIPAEAIEQYRDQEKIRQKQKEQGLAMNPAPVIPLLCFSFPGPGRDFSSEE